MSLGFKEKGIVGGPLDLQVRKQLLARKKVISKLSERGPDDITYLTSNTGWVRITSAVDVETPSDSKAYSSELATRYQLIGGIASATEGFSLNENSSYIQDSTYGFVPVPGVTSFSVKSQGTYGTLRSATFNFTVHSPEDFSKLEQIYLRPGFTILLEWGHSIYVNDEGEISSVIDTFPLDQFTSKMSRKDIEQLIKDKKKSNFNNYDALYGFIKNFAWSYNGINYECQVDVVSKGEIIKSIRSTFAPIFDDKNNTTDPTYDSKNFPSEIEKFLNTIKRAPSEQKFFNEDLKNTSLGDITLTALNLTSPNLTSYITEKLGSVGEKFQVIAASLGGNVFDRESSWTKYIPLRVFLMMVNRVSLLYSQGSDPVAEFYVGGDDTSPRFLTFPNHIALDPKICVLPKQKGKLPELAYPMSSQVEYGADQVEDILNIFVSTTLITEVIKERRKNTEDKNNTLYNVVEDIMKEVQKTLGNINEFVIHFDEENSLFYIADKKVIPSKKDMKTGDDANPESFIDLVGLSSEIENLNITSKLSENLTSMIAIAAQAGTNSSAGAEMLNIQKWNKGLRDRHLVETTVGTTETQKPDLEPTIDQTKLKDFKSYLEQINKGNNYYIGYAPEGKAEVHTELMGEYQRVETEKAKTNPPGLIPFELSFTMKGIGGMKIGQAFRVNEFFLPERYRGNVGFIITGLDHKIQNGRWTTDVKTQLIVL